MKMKFDTRSDWDKLFDILQVLNPESDKCLLPHPINPDMWDDICYYMSLLQPEEEEKEEMFEERDRAMERYTSKLKNKLKELK